MTKDLVIRESENTKTICFMNGDVPRLLSVLNAKHLLFSDLCPCDCNDARTTISKDIKKPIKSFGIQVHPGMH